MAKPPADRRVQRTQRALHAALLDSIREHGWEAVRIQDVCERANVGRSTFYAHFADKEELLVSGFEGLRLELRAHAASHGGARLAFARPLLEHVRDYWWVFRILTAKRDGHIVRDRLVELIVDELLAYEGDVPAADPRHATARYVAGAFLELVRWWLETKHAPSVDEVATRFERMSEAAMRSAGP